MARQYPRRQYPAVVVGSANGAAVHLWAALGIPWLPQTFLVPIARSGVHPDDPARNSAGPRPMPRRSSVRIRISTSITCTTRCRTG